MDQDVKDAIFKVMVAFTDKQKMADEFIPGLTTQQYAVLRDLNILRIDCGDDRIPEDWHLEGIDNARLVED